MKKPSKPRTARAAGRTVVDRLARLGLGSRGLVYLLIAWIALRIAVRRGGGQQADGQGALQEFAHNAPGKVLLVVMAFGFGGYAAWRVTEAIWGHRDVDGLERWVRRAAAAGRAALYLAFCVGTFSTALRGSSGGGSDSASKKAAAGLLSKPGGPELVIAVGAGFAIAGVALAVAGVLGTFKSNLDTKQMGKRVEQVTAVLGVVGQTARGVVFGIVGGFLVDSATTYDPQKAQGLDGALRSLSHGSWGPPLLIFVALGLASFGLYSVAAARYLET